MPQNLAAPPLQTPLVEPPERGKPPSWLITRVWNDWFRSIVDRAQVSAYALISVPLTGQTASIGLTTLVPVAAAGLYRISYYVRVTTAASVSSSILVSVHSTEGAVACTQSGAAYTGNLVDAPQSGAFIVRADPASPVQFSTTYASAGTPMAYRVDVIAERL